MSKAVAALTRKRLTHLGNTLRIFNVNNPDSNLQDECKEDNGVREREFSIK